MPENKTIKAQIWQLSVSNGVMDMIHGNYYVITEFYVPDYNLSFNVDYDGSQIRFFDSYPGRYKPHDSLGVMSQPEPKLIATVNIQKSFVEKLKLLSRLKDESLKEALDLYKSNNIEIKNK